MKLIKSHPISFTILAIMIFITTILVVTALNLRDTAEVEIRIAPASATITIDGKQYQNGSYKLPKGDLSVHIEKDGFIPQDLIVNNSDGATKIYSYLLQQDGTTSWYDTHESDAILLNTIGDYLANITAEKYNEQYPIMTVLPIIYANYDEQYNYTEYRIDGGKFLECQNEFCLKITDTTGDNQTDALEQIRSAGYNPDDYEIIYEFTPIQPLE